MTTALKAARASVIIIAVVAVLSLAISLILIDRARARVTYIVPTPQELAGALARAGLAPEPLTAAGLTIGKTEDVVANVNGYLINNPAALTDADNALAQARVAHDELLGKIRAGIASPEEINALPAARTALSNATAAREDVIDAIFGAGTDELAQQTVDTLSQIRANQSWRFPTEFQVLDWQEPQWLELRNALANERITTETGEDPHPPYETLLNTTRLLPGVSAAMLNLDTNLTAISNAWNEACGL